MRTLIQNLLGGTTVPTFHTRELASSATGAIWLSPSPRVKPTKYTPAYLDVGLSMARSDHQGSHSARPMVVFMLFAAGCGALSYLFLQESESHIGGVADISGASNVGEAAVPPSVADRKNERQDATGLELAPNPNVLSAQQPSPPPTPEPSPPPETPQVISETDPRILYAPQGHEGQYAKILREIEVSREEVRDYPWALKAISACEAAIKNVKAENLIPVWITPLVSDEVELETIMLPSIDVPVRHFHFVWNGDWGEMKKRVDVLRKIPHCVSVHHDPLNAGYAGSVNHGIQYGEDNAQELGIDLSQDWYFIANPDAGFPPGQLDRYAVQTNREKHRYAMTYGPRQDHFAFGLTRLAIDTVGLRDAAIYPIYMEDIEYRWRTQLAGLQLLVTGAQFNHVQSVNLRKHTDAAQRTRDALRRSGNGICYVRQKWGYYDFHEIEHFGPPSGWKKPFKLESAPLKLWAIDPVHRECLRTGRGPYFPHSDCCWYNVSVLLDQLPPGTTIPPPNDMPRNMHRGM
jgi:hypothetical protein